MQRLRASVYGLGVVGVARISRAGDYRLEPGHERRERQQMPQVRVAADRVSQRLILLASYQVMGFATSSPIDIT
jgi:hypothetical protein